MTIIEKKLSEIKPYGKNPRKNEKAIPYVMNSIKEFGFKVPIVIDKNGVIVAGHTRYLASKKLGLEVVPCIVADDLTDKQIKAFRLADNKVAEKAEWDMDLLLGELDDLLDFDMDLFGFEGEHEKKVVEDDYNPEPPAEPKAKRGDIYQLGRHRLMCGDSTSVDDVKKLMDGAEADMLLTDPPYNVNIEETAGKILNDNMKSDEFRLFLRNAFNSAKAVMRPGAVFHIWYGENEAYNFRGACQEAGLSVRQQLVWVKSQATLGRQDFQHMYESVLTGDELVDSEMEERGYEPCLYGWKDGTGHTWYKKRKERDVLFFDKPTHSAEHPTMKPILLFNYEMQCNTKAKDRVLDLFTGSGTTLIACEQNDRVAYCMEYDPKFVDVIIARWEAFTGETAVLVNPSEERAKE